MHLPRNLLLVYGVILALYSTEGFVNVVFPPYLAHQGIPLAQTGAILAAMALASLCSRLPAGLLYRPRRASPLIAGTAVLLAVVTIAYPRTETESVLAGLRLLHGFAFGIVTTLNMAQFMDVRPASLERGRAMGIFAACLVSGYTLGSALGGWWADRFGFESAFTVAAGFPLLVAVLNLQVQPDPAGAGPVRRTPFAGLGAGLGALTNPGVLLAALLLFCLNLLNRLFDPFFNLYALGIGLSLTTVGMIVGAANSTAILARLWAGELSGRWSYTIISRVGIAGSCATIFLVPTSTQLFVLAPLVVGLTVLRAVLTVTGGVNVIDATDATAEQRGVAAALFNIGKDLGSIAGPLSGGWIAAAAGIGPMLQIVALTTLGLFLGGSLLADLAIRRAQTRRLDAPVGPPPAWLVAAESSGRNAADPAP